MHITITGHGFVLTLILMIEQILRMKPMCAIAGGKVMIVSEYFTFEGESYVKAATYDEVLYKLKRANDKVFDLESKLEKSEAENTSLQDSHIKLYNDTKDTIRCLKDENKSLKQRIKDLEDVCGGSCFSDSEDERDTLIAELQDQHQQDCIKINQLHVTIDTLVDKYSRLRKTVGMD